MFSIDKRTLDDCTHGAIRVVNLRGMKTLMITLCSQYDGHGRQRFYLADKHIEVRAAARAAPPPRRQLRR